MANDKKFEVKNGLVAQNVEFSSPNRANTLIASMSNGSNVLSFAGTIDSQRLLANSVAVLPALKAWAYINQGNLTTSSGVSSVSKAAGYVSVNLSPAMSDANYAYNITWGSNQSPPGGLVGSPQPNRDSGGYHSAPTANNFSVVFIELYGSLWSYEPHYVYFSLFR